MTAVSLRIRAQELSPSIRDCQDIAKDIGIKFSEDDGERGCLVAGTAVCLGA